MKFRKTLVMVLAACLMVGAIAGTAFAANNNTTADPIDGDVKLESGVFDNKTETPTTPPEIVAVDPKIDFNAVYEFAIRLPNGDFMGTDTWLGTEEPYTGWWMYGDNWAYYRNGELQRHWQLINGDWYYFNKYGLMVQGGVAWIENRLWYFRADGVCDTTPGWKEVYGPFYVYENDFPLVCYPNVGTTLFYLNQNGYIETGWNYIEGGWRMIDKETGRVLQNEWYQGEGGYWYYLTGNKGRMATGWMTIADAYDTDRTYYFNEAGVLQQGWLKDNGNWYYLSEDNGARLENTWAQIFDRNGGWWYLFDNNGIMQTGWKNVKTGDKIYVKDGKVVNAPGQGVEEYDVVEWYYLSSWGAMVTGQQFINGKWYLFGETPKDDLGELQAVWDGEAWDYDIYDAASNYLKSGQSSKPKTSIIVY